MQDEPAASREEIEVAKRRGYVKGMNWGLLTVAIPCSLWAAIRSLAEVPKFEEVFKQVKVEMPALTMLVLNSQGGVGVGILVGLVACLVMTKRWGERKRMVLVNGGFLFFCFAWMMLFSVALYAPLLTLLEGIGQRKH